MRLAHLLALLTTCTLAPAQVLLFEDDFEAGLDQWTVDADGAVRFHDLRVTHPCASAAAPFPSAHHAVRAGRLDGCTFDDPTVAPRTSLTLNDPVDLPANATDLTLSYWSFGEVENTTCDYDRMWVYLSSDGGATWVFVGLSCGTHPWFQNRIDVTAWAGSSVQMRFEFDAIDLLANGGLGWIVDDVRLEMNTCGVTENYCIAAPNSAGPGAVMGWSGSTVIGDDDFTLTLSGGPPGQFAHFFFGPEPNQVPVADGFLCVGPGASGFVRLVPSGMIDGGGFLERELEMIDIHYLPSTLYFQAWYRDPSGGPSGSNFTDGLRVTFCK